VTCSDHDTGSGHAPASSPIILAFHKLRPDFSWGATNFSPRRFSRLLTSLIERGFSLESLPDATGGKGRAVGITFDDGYRHLLDHLPALMDRYHFCPTVFLPTGWIGRANCWDYSHFLQNDPHLGAAEIRQLASLGVEFGSHGQRHVDLRYCDPGQLAAELGYSRKALEDILGREVRTISYPFGGISQTVIAAARKAGYRMGFTMRFPEHGGEGGDPLALGRYAVYGYDTPFSIRQKVERGPLYRLERFKAGVTNRLSGGTRLLNALRSRRPTGN